MGLFLGLNSVALICVSFMPVLYRFSHYRFVVWSEVRESKASSLVLFSPDRFSYLGLWWFHMNFRIIRSSSVKNTTEILTEVALSL